MMGVDDFLERGKMRDLSEKWLYNLGWVTSFRAPRAAAIDPF
jgi:hypothetical protein